MATLSVLAFAGDASAKGALNKGALNQGAFNKGALNKGALNTVVFNKGALNKGALNQGAFNTSYMQDTMRVPATTRSGSLTQGQWKYLGAFPVTPGRTFSVRMTGVGDGDLYVKFGSSDYSTFDCRPYTGSSNENCDLVVPPGAATAYVSVKGYSASSTFSAIINGFDGSGILDTVFLNAGIESKTRIRGAGTVASNEWAQLGNFPVTAGNRFQVEMTGTNDADLYVKFGVQPGASVFDCRPYAGTSNETCDVTVPSGATMAYVAVAGYSSSSTFAVDILGFDMSVSGMTTNQGQGIDNAGLSGSALTGSAWTYGMVTECEEPYGCWQTWGWEYRTMSPYDFIGATQQINITDGDDHRVEGTADLRITGVTSHSSAQAPELIYSYKVEAYLGSRDSSGNTTWAWYPFCDKDASGSAIGAIPLQGAWNYQAGARHGGAKISSSANRITWACLDGALGKAAAGHSVALPNQQGTGYGYKPWASQSVWSKYQVWNCNSSETYCYWSSEWEIITSTGATAHQAATRMIRADYCGDGMAHTIAGRQLDVWDNLPNPVNTMGTPFAPDASWTSAGANDWGCNGRVDYLWSQDCGPGQVYCESSCPSHSYVGANGSTYSSTPHGFSTRDDGSWMCLDRSAYENGVGFNRNELVNTAETWGTVPDRILVPSIVR